jgi:hypothetical protein
VNESSALDAVTRRAQGTGPCQGLVLIERTRVLFGAYTDRCSRVRMQEVTSNLEVEEVGFSLAVAPSSTSSWTAVAGAPWFSCGRRSFPLPHP